MLQTASSPIRTSYSRPFFKAVDNSKEHWINNFYFVLKNQVRDLLPRQSMIIHSQNNRGVLGERTGLKMLVKLLMLWWLLEGVEAVVSNKLPCYFCYSCLLCIAACLFDLLPSILPALGGGHDGGHDISQRHFLFYFPECHNCFPRSQSPN